MRPIYYFFFCFIFYSTTSYAQGQWVWMKGANTMNQSAIYGPLSTPLPGNEPGSRYEAAEWTDLNGNFWIFGGTDGSFGYKSDLWKYDPASNMWSWEGGSQLYNQAGVYGTQGVPATGNIPGARGFAPVSWTDNNGDLWLYGGYGHDAAGAAGHLNDLWKYNIASGQWTWMSGSSIVNDPGTYGTITVPAATNVPKARTETACSWKDSNGNLWFFGGSRNGTNLLNDLWKYYIGTNQWVWMSGSNTFNQAGVYGTKGVAAAGNIPGAREIHAGWTNNGTDFWLFGGYTQSLGAWNDLWKYNITSGMWTWMSGSNTVNAVANYGTQCITNPNNVPGSRTESRSRWTDDCGNLWMLGGIGETNDLWKYNITTNEWVWVSGTNIPGNIGSYGTQGIISPANIPPSRGGANAWRTKEDFWLYAGGYGISKQGDLWKYIPDKPTAQYTMSANSGCVPLTVNFTDASNAGCNEIKSYQWFFDDPSSGSNNTSTLQHPGHQFLIPGTYNVKLLVTNCTGSKDSSIQSIIVFPDPVQTVAGNLIICSGTSTSLTVSGASSYVWMPGTGLSSTTGNIVTANPTSNSTYTITGTDNNGCISTTTLAITVNSSYANAGNDTAICIGGTATLNASGNILYQWSTGTTTSSITVSPPITSVYTVTVGDGFCFGTDNVTVTVHTLPSVNITGNIYVSPGNSTMLSVNNGNTCSWMPSTGLSCNNCCNPTVNVNATTTYTVTVTDVNGCTSTDTITVYIINIYVPNAFSPNGDNENDLLYVAGQGIKNFSFIIFDRWGNKVFESADPLEKWNGTFNNKPLDSGVYTYYLRVRLLNNEDVVKKGNISLIR